MNHETNIAFINPHPERDRAAYNHSLATAPTPMCILTLFSRESCMKWFCQHIDTTSCKTNSQLPESQRNKFEWKICGGDLKVQRKHATFCSVVYLLRNLCSMHPSFVTTRRLFACGSLRFSLAPAREARLVENQTRACLMHHR